jgi:phosphohistidine phosphatase SixA
MKKAFTVALFLSQLAIADVSLLDIPEPFTVIIRTPSATIGTDNPRPLVSGQDCSAQRQIDEQGLKQIQELKKDFESFLNVGEVYASEYCRSYQTAARVFPNQQVQIRGLLNDACFNSARQNKANNVEFQTLVNQATSNRIVFAHNCNIRMLFSTHIKRACNEKGRLEAGQWIAVKKTGESLSVVACSD